MTDALTLPELATIEADFAAHVGPELLEHIDQAICAFAHARCKGPRTFDLIRSRLLYELGTAVKHREGTSL